jgi:CD109 antigen
MKCLWHRTAMSCGALLLLLLPLTTVVLSQDLSNEVPRFNTENNFNQFPTPNYRTQNEDLERSTFRDTFGNSIDQNNPFSNQGTFGRDFDSRTGSNRDSSRERDRTRQRVGPTGRNRDRTNYNALGRNPLLDGSINSAFQRDATYFVVASKMVRPNQIYRVFVSVFIESEDPITVRASISRDGVEMSSDSQIIKTGEPETLLMRVPPTTVPGEYKLRVEGKYEKAFGGIAFLNETKLTFSQRSMTIFVQTNKPVYKQGDMVQFRAIPITTELKGFDNAVDVYMLDPNRHVMRRWLSRQSNLGTVSLEYKLSDQPVYGEWIIKVVAQGQTEEHKFIVEEYYQTRFEVNVTMPAFFFNTDPYLHGKVMANFTNGSPVRGNLTLRAIIRPIGFFDPKNINQQFRVWNMGYQQEEDPRNPRYDNYKRTVYNYNTELYSGKPGYSSNNPFGNSQFNTNQYSNPTVDQSTDQRYTGSYSDQYVVETRYNFDEEWPFWVDKPEQSSSWNRYGADNYNQNTLPYLRFFNGTFDFKYPMYELERMVPNLANMEILIIAQVGERYYDEIIEGYSVARVYNNSIKVSFMGGTPQVLKPMMPMTSFIVAEYHDGSKLPLENYYQSVMEVTGTVDSRSGGRRDYPQTVLRMSEKPGVWELKIDLRNDLQLDDSRTSKDFLRDISSLRLYANYIDPRGERAQAEILYLSHYSPNNNHIKVTTSTTNGRVGEYIVFHIESNFFMETFQYMVMSKGIILTNGVEAFKDGVRTMSVTLSAEMAPVATMVVWNIGAFGQIVADTVTFPVNGISRNNFTVFINNRKHRTGEKVEVAIYGEPGSYVGVSGIDNAFYTMQAGNELTYANIISQMSAFDEETNGTFAHRWYSHQGNPDELVYYPSSTFGIDANRTFEYVGLLVFTDGVVPRRQDNCNISTGYAECLNGRCYRLDKKCDGFFDCEDGADEAGCNYQNHTLLSEFRKYRFNRIQRHYENVWMWKDVNIGPHGRYVFTLDVPDIPALWMVSAFSISPSLGFGMVRYPLEYVGCQPFYINVEMPTDCRQGEQVGIRVTVFNYMTTSVEATVVLHGSPDYKFVHVEEDGIVTSYNPRTSYGEHQFFIYLESQSSTIVYIPIVPTRLGDIKVKVHASTLLGSDRIERMLHVEADGLPQYRHQSILLDLSNRAYAFQYMHVNVTETPIIPYEVERYYVYGSNKAQISLVGDVVGPIFPTMPVNATSLLYLPMEAAEQNMFSFAANIYTIMYMRLINQRNRTTEKEAFKHINIGYQRQMSYLMPDGSFSLFRSDWNQSASSVWLTAYCARTFQDANFYEWENFIYIDPVVLQKNMAWLLRHQLPEGSFYEVTWLPNRKVNDSSNYQTRYFDTPHQYNISLTAHVLITLTTVKDLADGLSSRISLAQQRAVQYLDQKLVYLKDFGTPYEKAIVAYALMLAKAPKAEQAFNMLADIRRHTGEFSYWSNDQLPLPPTKLENQKYFSLPRLPYEFDSMNIETTAYALLTYVSRQEILVDSIVNWLNSQRLTDGGWASTQDTGIALKALIEYTIRTRIRDVSQLALTVEATSLQGQTKHLTIHDKNIANLQTLDVSFEYC